MLRRAAWGIDLTGGSLKAVRIERRQRRFHILEALDLPYATPGEGAQRLHVHLPKAARQALHLFLQEHNATLTDPVFVGIHGYGGEQGTVSVPAAPGDRQEELLDYELRSRLRSSMDGLIVRAGCTSGRVRRRVDRVHFVAMRRRVVEPFLRDVRDVGCPVDGLVPEPVALKRYLDVEWPGTGRRLVLHVQRTRTDLLYLTDDGLRYRALPLGIGGLTGFSSGSRTPPREEVQAFARRLWKEHGQAASFFFGDVDSFPLERLLLVGDGEALPTLHRAIEEVFGHAPERVGTQRWFTVSSRLTHGTALDLNQMGTALGLAIGALRRGGEEYSLLPPDPARRAQRLRPSLAFSLLVVAASLLALHLIAGRQQDGLQRDLARSSRELEWNAQDQAEDLLAEATVQIRERELLRGHAAALARHSHFPRQLLDALAGPTAFFRLVELDLVPDPDGDGDRVRSLVEVPDGLPAAVDQVKRWMEGEVRLRETEARLVETREESLYVEVSGRLRGGRP